MFIQTILEPKKLKIEKKKRKIYFLKFRSWQMFWATVYSILWKLRSQKASGSSARAFCAAWSRPPTTGLRLMSARTAISNHTGNMKNTQARVSPASSLFLTRPSLGAQAGSASTTIFQAFTRWTTKVRWQMIWSSTCSRTKGRCPSGWRGINLRMKNSTTG